MEAKTELQYAQEWVINTFSKPEWHHRCDLARANNKYFVYNTFIVEEFRKEVIEPWTDTFDFSAWYLVARNHCSELTSLTTKEERNFFLYRREVLEKEVTPIISEDKEAGWISSEVELPYDGENVEISDDGITVRETADYKTDRRCMMAGIAWGNGYFGSLGFATDGSTGCETNLILDTPAFWRRYDTSPPSEKQPEDEACTACGGEFQSNPDDCPLCNLPNQPQSSVTEEGVYKGYSIQKNPYSHKGIAEYTFTSISDCDRPVGFGNSVLDCVNQINDEIEDQILSVLESKLISNGGMSLKEHENFYNDGIQFAIDTLNTNTQSK